MIKTAIENEFLVWNFGWINGSPVSISFCNKLSGKIFNLSGVSEILLNTASDFESEIEIVKSDYAIIHFHSAVVSVDAHYQLDGHTRRKWLEIRNQDTNDLLLLDISLDDFIMDAPVSGGGQGQPIFISDEVFAAIEHPAGVNQADNYHIQMLHHPGKHLPVGGSLRSHVALVSVAKSGQALEYFVSYIQEKSLRKKEMISIYTPFGINNQWGVCPTLDDEQTIDVLNLLEKWQQKGMRFDYFTLDTGWVDPSSDLTEFRPTAYPNGPKKVIERVNSLGMKFGLWFATSWAAESCWNYPPAWDSLQRPIMKYRNGYPARAEYGGSFCMASEPYVSILRNAVLHHVRENNVRFLKFDGGNYYCESTEHGHLPGKYSTERMYENLIEIANSARAIAPDIYIMWYWGLRSPFWALYGDSIFESGLHMEGSGTSSSPALYYRDSVTLAQDQNAQFAKTIPPIVKDSLGVWLADTRWGNYMGKERWKESLIMDLGRGNMLFPNIWGNLYHLTDDEVDFLAWISSIAKKNQSLFLKRHNILGDPWKNEVYGYAYFLGDRGFIFINNAHFASRKVSLLLDSTIGMEAGTDTLVHVISHFPEKSLLTPNARFGDIIEINLRPFEVLMLEVTPLIEEISLPLRSVSDQLGFALSLQPVQLSQDMEVLFADASLEQQLFCTGSAKTLTKNEEQRGYIRKACAFEAALPPIDNQQHILAITVRLRIGDKEWRYSPAIVEIVQAVAFIDGHNIQLVAVPDARQFGNTQKAGCSWMIYKVRLSHRWSGKDLKLAVHSWLPEGVEAQIEAWVVKRWWQEYTRPMGDGYYADAPS